LPPEVIVTFDTFVSMLVCFGLGEYHKTTRRGKVWTGDSHLASQRHPVIRIDRFKRLR
jgi:hypothetical protein